MSPTIVSIISLALTIYACVYMYRSDKVEKEPIRLLLLLFAAGIGCFFLCAFAETKLLTLVDRAFDGAFVLGPGGQRAYLSETWHILHFLGLAAGIAVTEEVVRGLVLALITRKNKNFDYRYDGFVYAVFLYLGYGCVESFRYIQTGGVDSLLFRSIRCIPIQLFMGLIMGWFYVNWVKRKTKLSAVLWILGPAVIHTLREFLQLYGAEGYQRVTGPATVALCLVCVLMIRGFSKHDAKLTVLVLALLMSASVLRNTSVARAAKSTVTQPTAQPTTQAAVQETTPAVTQAEQPKFSGAFYYKSLDADGKKCFQQIDAAVKDGALRVEFTDLSQSAGLNAGWAALEGYRLEHPEAFWLRGNGTAWSRWGTLVSLDFATYSYWNQTLDKQGKIDELEAAVNKIVKKAKKIEGKYDRVEYVHDYLTKLARYDHESLAKAKQTIHDPSLEYIWSAYGCLVNKACVCLGYADAFQIIMTRLGFKCDVVVGDAGGPHAWNRVKWGGEYYYVDVTWDDWDTEYNPNYPDIAKDPIHTYFMVDAKTISADHTPGQETSLLPIPEASGTKYNYYTVRKYYVKKYSASAVNDVLKKQKNHGMLEVKFGSKKELNKAVKAVKDGSINKISALKNKQYWWLTKDEYNTLIFLFDKSKAR